MNVIPSVLRQAAAAQRSAGKGNVVDLLHQCTRNQHALALLNLRSFLTSCSALDADDGKPETPATSDEAEHGNSLPENATAAEMRQWADRMLGHKAAAKPDDEVLSTATEIRARATEEGDLQAASEALPEDAQLAAPAMSALAEEEETALPEEYDLAVEEDDLLEAAAAVDVPMTHAAEDAAAAEVSPAVPEVEEAEAEEEEVEESPTEAWIRFVREKFGQESFGQQVLLPAEREPRRSAAAAEAAALPAWRRFMMDKDGDGKSEADEAARKLAKEAKTEKLPDFFNMKDPRRELERLLPESARRHGLTQSPFIQPMRDSGPDRENVASAPVTFKASAPLDPSEAAAASTASTPPEPPPRRVTVLEPPMDRLANPVTGYANLGRPRSERMGANRDDMSLGETKWGHIQDSPRLHPTRIFYPGQTYDPEDLVDSGEQIGWRKHAVKVSTEKATNNVVRARADFRNQAFLNTFISDLGKLPPKRTTRLQQKTHRHLCRQIKLARQMALLPVDSQLSADYLQRTGAARRVAEPIVEHNPHLRPLVFDRSASLTYRGAGRPRGNGEHGQAAAPRPSRWYDLAEQLP